MIPLLALMLFLMSAYYVLDAYSATKSAQKVVEEVSFKMQASYVFFYTLPFVLDLLKRDDPSVDSLQDSWAKELTFTTEKGELRITIYDEERFLNLNSVDEGLYGKFFERLLRLLAIDPSYKENLLVWTGKSKGTINTEYPIKRAPLDAKEELYYMGFDKARPIGKGAGREVLPGAFRAYHSGFQGKGQHKHRKPLCVDGSGPENRRNFGEQDHGKKKQRTLQKA
jgi:general secretion pathway protein K